MDNGVKPISPFASNSQTLGSFVKIVRKPDIVSPTVSAKKKAKQRRKMMRKGGLDEVVLKRNNEGKKIKRKNPRASMNAKSPKPGLDCTFTKLKKSLESEIALARSRNDRRKVKKLTIRKTQILEVLKELNDEKGLKTAFTKRLSQSKMDPNGSSGSKDKVHKSQSYTAPKYYIALD